MKIKKKLKKIDLERADRKFIVVSILTVLLFFCSVLIFMYLTSPEQKNNIRENKKALRPENEILGFLYDLRGHTRIDFYPPSKLNFEWKEIVQQGDVIEVVKHNIKGYAFGVSCSKSKKEKWKEGLDLYFESLDFFKNTENATNADAEEVYAYTNGFLACQAKFRELESAKENSLLVSCGSIRREGDRVTIKSILREQITEFPVIVEGLVKYSEDGDEISFEIEDSGKTLRLWECEEYKASRPDRENQIKNLKNGDKIEVNGRLKKNDDDISDNFCVKIIKLIKE